MGAGLGNTKAGVLELVDEVDSKSIASDGVRVRVPPPAPSEAGSFFELFFRETAPLRSVIIEISGASMVRYLDAPSKKPKIISKIFSQLRILDTGFLINPVSFLLGRKNHQLCWWALSYALAKSYERSELTTCYLAVKQRPSIEDKLPVYGW